MFAVPRRHGPPILAVVLLPVLVAVVLVGCSDSAPDNPPPPSTTATAATIPETPQPTAAPVSPAGLEELQTAVGDWLIETGTVGVAVVALMPNGRTLSAVGGWSDREEETPVATDTIFRIGSITKVYTAALIMHLVETGMLTLEDSVREYVPEAPQEMTIGHLLSHRSGLRDVDVAAGIFEAIQNPTETAAPEDTIGSALQQLAFDPGLRQSYSSIGYLVLERVVEAATGQDYEDVLRERILVPLDLTATMLERSDSALATPYERLTPSGPQVSLAALPTTGLARAAGAAGALVAPAQEVAAFAAALFEAMIVSQESLMTMMNTSGEPLAEFGTGLAVYPLAGGKTFGHNGRTIGFASSLRHDPAGGVTVVVLSNDGSAATDVLADSLVVLLASASDS